MDKNVRIIMIILVALVAANLLWNIFGMNKGINDAIKNLKDTSIKIDTALQQINSAKLEIQQIRTDIDSFQGYTQQVQLSARELDEIKNANAANFSKTSKSITSKIDSLKTAIKGLNVSVQPIPVDTL